MSRDPRSVSPDALRLRLDAIERRLGLSTGTTTIIGGGGGAELTDATPRWVRYSLTPDTFQGLTGASATYKPRGLPALATITAFAARTVTPPTGPWVTWTMAFSPFTYVVESAVKGLWQATNAAPDQAGDGWLFLTADDDINFTYSVSGCNVEDTDDYQVDFYLLLSIPGSTNDTLPHA